MTYSPRDQDGAGYQGSDKSGIEVSIYGHGNDPVFATESKRGKIDIRGAAGVIDATGDLAALESSAVSSFTWAKMLGAPSGRWTLELKTREPEIFLRAVNDDDWIDITLTQHDHKFHICRGLIDTIRISRAVNKGATTTSFLLTGRDHGKPFEVTPIFFNKFIAKNANDVDAAKAYQAAFNKLGSWGGAAVNVRTLLLEYFNFLDNGTAASWKLPPGMPNANGATFFEVMDKTLNVDGHDNFPSRLGFNPTVGAGLEFEGHTLWQLAHDWSDPAFTELIVDLVDATTLLPPIPGKELTPETSAMGVVFRDKPFPNQTNPKHQLMESPWFSLPLYVVTPQELGSGTSEGRGGDERFNSFIFRLPENNEALGQIDYTKPLWDEDDIASHGLRKMDIGSQYVPFLQDNTEFEYWAAQQELLRDWYGLNPYFLNGTLPLAHLRPDIRIGSRARVPGLKPNQDLTYYVEGVNHAWSLGRGRTSLTVTRGWMGTDQDLMSKILDLTGRYIRPKVQLE